MAPKDRLQPATCFSTGCYGRVVTGPRAGRWVVRLGRDPRADVVISGARRQAHMRGFDLHADTAVGESERDRLERLCRYVLRPPLAGDALELSEDGSLLLRLRRRWRDGTEAIRFEPWSTRGCFHLLASRHGLRILYAPCDRSHRASSARRLGRQERPRPLGDRARFAPDS